MRIKTFTLLLLSLLSTGLLKGQTILTSEDSLNTNLTKGGTSIGGYGNAFYQRNANLKTSNINLERMVLFLGHRFAKNISVFSEWEIEDAKLVGGESGGEFAIEQAYLKFDLNPNQYITAGLFIPRIGILNENHLPNNFNGNERTLVETYIIPSTWRELGIGFYGRSSRFPINYSLALVNGLNSAAFAHGSGIREGRFEGRSATANNLAITGSVQAYAGNLKTQISGYYGGTVGVSKYKADSLGLNSGIFGTPVVIGEVDLVYEAGRFTAKVLGTIVSIPDANAINLAYANNTPETEYGAYAEIAYDIYPFFGQPAGSKQLIVFVRDEQLDMNASIPESGIYDGTLKQNHLVAGFSYFPVRNVVIKGDVRISNTGKQNPDLVINPSPVAPPYRTSNNFINLGIGFSF